MNLKKTTITKIRDVDTGFGFIYEPVSEPIITQTKNGYTLKYLTRDTEPICPDEYDNDTLFLVFYHRQFNVENKNIKKEDLVQLFRDPESIINNTTHYLNDYHVFWVSALIHSNIHLSLASAFAEDPGGWDTSLAGAILIKKSEYPNKDKAHKAAKWKLDDWNSYLSGDVYGCVMETFDKDKNPIDHESIWGYFGYGFAQASLENEF